MKMSKRKKSGKVAPTSESKVNLTAAILNLVTAILILIDKIAN